MSRTPLFHGIERALRRAAAEVRFECARQSAPVPVVSRRTFVQSGALLAAAPAGLLACRGGTPASAVQASEPKGDARVVVVGAGLAGLSCAYQLAKAGVRAEVYDANSRVGGRIFTERGPAFGAPVELGGEFIDSGHTRLRELVVELGLTLFDLAAASAKLEPERYFIGASAYTEKQIVKLFRPVSAAVLRDLKAMGEPGYVTYNEGTERGRELDRMSLSEWFEHNSITGPIRALLEAAYTGEYGLESDAQSCLNLLLLIGAEPEPFALYGESDERYTVLEGNDAMTTRLAEHLKPEVQLGQELLAVQQRADGSLLAIFGSDRGRREVAADRLVLAIPFNQLRKVSLGFPLSPAKQRSLAGLRYGTNAKLLVGTASRPWQEHGLSGTTFSDQVYHESWDATRRQSGTTFVLTAFSGGKLGVELGSGTPEAQAARFLARFEQVCGGAQKAYTGHCARFHWPSAKFFEGSYACYGPGDYASFVGSEAEAEGNVHFCGEHTSTEAQGYMAGALDSGERVAREISVALGKVRATTAPAG